MNEKAELTTRCIINSFEMQMTFLLDILTLSLVPVSCGLMYKWPVAMYALGHEIVPNTPLDTATDGGGGGGDQSPRSYSVSPNLPYGLVLDSRTGEMSGIPQGEPSAGWFEIQSGVEGEWANVYIVVDDRVPDAWLGMPPITPRETTTESRDK